MSRYVERPRAWSSDTHVMEVRPTCEVLMPDPSPIRTGLLAASGMDLYRLPDTIPCGFRRADA